MPRSRSVLTSLLVVTTAGSAAADADIVIGGGMLESAAHRTSTYDVTGFGAGLELQLAYRVRPQLALGTYATVEAGNPTLDSAHRNFFSRTAGLRAEWHFDPSLSIDSWISLGFGARWTSSEDDRMSASTSLLGVELAKFQFGGDFPVGSSLLIGPVVAFSASVFVANESPATDGYAEIDDKALDLTITTGVRVRLSSK